MHDSPTAPIAPTASLVAPVAERSGERSRPRNWDLISIGALLVVVLAVLAVNFWSRYNLYRLDYEPASLLIGRSITTATAIAIPAVAGVYFLRPRAIRRRVGRSGRSRPDTQRATRPTRIPPNHRPIG